MKKRTLLLPLSVFMLIGCSPNADVRNKYVTEADCLKDNPAKEIKDGIDDDEDRNNFDSNKLCEKIVHDGQTYYAGPAYPHGYYGHSGFYNGYWIGRMSNYSSGIVHESGQSFTHSQIASGGGISGVVSRTASGTSISRGGFGTYGRSSFGS